jgi:hypothetical protein
MNGQVERTNGLILQGRKTRMFQDLEAKGRNWYKELPSVLWALQTNVNRANRDTPFNLVYRVDAVSKGDTLRFKRPGKSQRAGFHSA